MGFKDYRRRVSVHEEKREKERLSYRERTKRQRECETEKRKENYI